MRTEIISSFLSLARLSIGHSADSRVLIKDWQSIKELAEAQGLYAILLDGIEMLPENSRPPQRLLLEWIGEVLRGYEYRYEEYKRTIYDMACFYDSHGYKMMVLKGYACSLNWPRPEHRPCGDIDIWLFGKQKEADAVLANEKKIDIDNSHHHHTVFNWGIFTVENHYDFINIHRHYSHIELESTFKELGQDDDFYVELKDYSSDSATKLYLPSPNLHALFLVRHALNHFASIGINLRQVLDWAFFAEKHTHEIDWQWLTSVLEKYHMMDFYNCMNEICVEDLGFDAMIFNGIRFNPYMKEKVIADILNSDNDIKIGIINMLKRWRKNLWKQRLCYKENVWASFMYGVLCHFMKPKSIE